MLQKIQHFITTQRLPQPPAPLLVALSGGADSVALLLILQQLGYRITALHCNFHLRGAESDRDEKFVRGLCEKQALPLLVQHFNTTEYAATRKISIEMAARELRYNWFETVREETHSQAIAVAHHSDDNAETLLLNLIRGTGIRGLKGMLPQQGHIIRPLLGVRRCEIENFLKERNQTYVTDSTNLETVYKRNRIRHELLPMLRKLNPAIDEQLAQTAQRMAQAEHLYRYAVDHLQQEICTPLSDGILIDIKKLLAEPTATTLLHEFLLPYGFSPAEIEMMGTQLLRPTGTCFHSATHLAVVNRGLLEVRQRPCSLCPTPLPATGKIQLPDGKLLVVQSLNREELTQIPKQSDRVALDCQCLQGQLTVRSTQEGDRFQPYGMKGTKLVSDYLTDRHRSLIDKQKALVLCDEQGIVWLVGERIAQRAAITDATQKVLLLALQ